MLNTIVTLKIPNKLLGLIIILNLVFIGFVNPATAEKKTENNQQGNSNYGLPTHRRDGGSRSGHDNCTANTESHNLVALIPKKAVGINASNSPKLFFYVPEVNNNRTLEFILRNEQDELMYEAFLTTAGNGVMSVEVPTDLHRNQLETEQNYHWYLSMICNPQQRSRDIVVEGWMRQEGIDFATKQELDAANSIEKAELYHEKGFWYDALSVLASKKSSSTEQPLIQAKWSELLKSVGLEELASAPLIETEMIKTSASFK